MNSNHDAYQPGLLAGYADGELDATNRAIVEAWLNDHPEDRAELEAQQLFVRKNSTFWQRASLPQVNEIQWNELFGKICAAVQPTRPAYREPVAPAWRRWAVGIAAIAVAGLIAVNLNLGRRPANDNDLSFPTGEAFAVASADDVDIISIQGEDIIIIVGRPPLAGPLEMIPIGEVVLESIFSDADGHLKKVDINPADPRKPIFIDPNKTQPVP